MQLPWFLRSWSPPRITSVEPALAGAVYSKHGRESAVAVAPPAASRESRSRIAEIGEDRGIAITPVRRRFLDVVLRPADGCRVPGGVRPVDVRAGFNDH